MPIRSHVRWLIGVPIAALLVLAMPAGARTVELVAADERGVTLRMSVADVTVSAPGADGRARLEAPGFSFTRIPGRPYLPFAAATVALPPGARAVARVLPGDGEGEGEGEPLAVRLVVASRPGFRDDPDLGVIPIEEIVEPERDGPWPLSPVEVEEPFSLRRQRVSFVRLYPFRYDEASGRLWKRPTLTVRVDFVGGEPLRAAPQRKDRYWEPVLESTIINYQQGRRWRSAPERAQRSARSLFQDDVASPVAGAAFDEDQPEVRVRIDTTGCYALNFDRLAAAGFAAGVSIAEVSVHRHEFVENSNPPYVTIELPIEVDDANQNGIFDAGDRILVFVQNWAERSKVTHAQRLWGDAEVIYATHLPGRAGLRVASRPGWLGLSLGSLASYPWRQRWEENPFYLAGFQPGVTDTNDDIFHWTNIQTYANPSNFPFAVNDLDTSRSAQVWVRWEGRKNTPYITWASVRNGIGLSTAVADSAAWSGRGPFSATKIVNGSALTNGNTNTLRAWGKTNPSDPSATAIVNTGFNWFEVEYWRAYKALAGYLTCNSGGVSGNYQIEARGFITRGIRVYDVTDSLAPVRLAIADSLITPDAGLFKVRFQDTSPGGATRRYVAFNAPKAVSAERYTRVTRRTLTNRSSGDYLLIVPEQFLPAVEPLRALRQSQGMDVVMAPLESVNDEFNGGRHSAYSIRRFLEYAYANWDARFVLLVGDGSEDPRNFLGNSSKDWVPVQKIGGPVTVSDGTSSVLETIPSDPWYVWCLDCPNMQTAPKLHDMFIGRLPVGSLQQTQDVVAKLIAYEQVGQDDAWRRRMLLLADDKYSTSSFFGGGSSGGPEYCRRGYEQVFVDINESCSQVILNEAMLFEAQPEVFDLGFFLANEPVFVPRPSDTCRVSWNDTQQRAHANVTPQIFERLNKGVLWWNYQGHANQYVMSHEDIYVNRGVNDDKDKFLNDGKLFLFSAFACHPNGFAVAGDGASNRGPAFGEEMVTLPNRGAVASWGSSGFEILPGSFSAHLNVWLARALFSDPPRDEDSGEANVVLGEAIAKALVDNLAAAVFSLERQVGISYHLLGDPATRFSIGRSQFEVFANGQAVTSGEPVRLTTAGDSLRLEADLASNVAITSVTLERSDDAGTQVIPPSEYTITPAFPDTAAGGVGGRKYHLSHRTTVLEVESFTYTVRTVDRYGKAGTFDVFFPFETVLRSGGVAIDKGDVVAADAEIELFVNSPKILTAGEIAVTLNGNTLAIDPQSENNGHAWTITWANTTYSAGDYILEFRVNDVVLATYEFSVVSGLQLVNVIAFPNPFDDAQGTRFSFTLSSSRPADLLIRVFTVSGRLIYEQKALGLMPGYHQLPWDGRDSESQKLANGVYLYRLIARDGSEKALYEGRLVKLRKPRRASLDNESSP